MHHLVAPITDTPIPDAIALLAAAHDYLVGRAAEASSALATVPRHRWGIQAKRTSVEFGGNRPELVTKASERFAEVLNIVATLERLIDALRWFQDQPAFSGLAVRECHPSTSHTPGGNDLVLADATGAVRVRCEVSDVVARNAQQNSKERIDLAALGIQGQYPDDGVSRFLIVSSEFCHALDSPRRAWHRLPYRYMRHMADFDHATTLLQVVKGDASPA
jgi:hypothetical protein